MAGLKSHSWYPRRSNCTRALTLPMADRGCNKSLPFTPSGIWYQYGHSESIQGEARLQPMPKQTEVPPSSTHSTPQVRPSYQMPDQKDSNGLHRDT